MAPKFNVIGSLSESSKESLTHYPFFIMLQLHCSSFYSQNKMLISSPWIFSAQNILFPDFPVTPSFSLFRSEFKYHQLFADHSSRSTTVPSTIFNPLHSTFLLQQTLRLKLLYVYLCVSDFFFCQSLWKALHKRSHPSYFFSHLICQCLSQCFVCKRSH